MKKTIRIRMTNQRASEYGFNSGYELVLAPIELDLDVMSPGARWIAEHITATYIIDELEDVIDIIAVASFSMAERDRRQGKSKEYIDGKIKMFGDFYTDPIKSQQITFPIFGKRIKTPEEVIEITYRELVEGGAAKLVARNGDEFYVQEEK